MLTGVQALIEDGQLKIQRGLKEAATLVRELTNIRVRQKARGRTSMGADGQGQHDDLALAVALACWLARRMEVGQGTRRLPGI